MCVFTGITNRFYWDEITGWDPTINTYSEIKPTYLQSADVNIWQADLGLFHCFFRTQQLFILV